ncbi:hypothetical protein [Gluconobacter kondonii]|uniref:hypothetical protein n=1 Tax=Gluconobacter kondonii TaxID=941463 RepID=UPI001B8C5C63|nr:hypothetical protein [Gluconobacter kondonii]MBS1079096.1 hypothetical protein [Gluconobacter kondonii]
MIFLFAFLSLSLAIVAYNATMKDTKIVLGGAAALNFVALLLALHAGLWGLEPNPW